MRVDPTTSRLSLSIFANSLLDLRRDLSIQAQWTSSLDWDFCSNSTEESQGLGTDEHRSYSMAGRLFLSPAAHQSRIQNENLAAGVRALLGGARRGAGSVR